ncbi:MAG TPA: S8 family serine peptidase [Candidatus Limnocylindrales bacterium]|nr:S8 family serine peptidase [Candidatus Limnocylindrales bacterium]
MGRIDARTPSLGAALLLTALLATVVAPAGAVAAGPASSPGPARATGPRAVTPAPATTILVRYRDGASTLARGLARARAAVTRQRGRADLQLDVVAPARGQSMGDALAALNADPAVAFAEPNSHVTLAADPAQEEYFPVQWGLENHGGDCVGADTDALGLTCVSDVDIDAIAGWSMATGAGVTIAILDDGLDFSQAELTGQRWVNPGESGKDGANKDKATNGIDDDGNGFVDDVNGVNLCAADAPSTTLHRAGVDWHGTAVASIVAAAVNGTKTVGVAPDAKLMAVRWLIAGTCDTMFDAINAIDYAVANGADVINASWGGPDDSFALEQAIGRANDAGVLVAAAAGNAGATAPFYPAASSSPNVISVGALGPDGRLADFSNRGSWVDIAAPGDAIAALCLSPDTRSTCPAQWSLVPGTSFAAPHVAGVAAMVLQLRPELKDNASALRTKLINAGVKSTKLAAGRTGSGRRLNAGYAVDIVPPSAPAVQVRARGGSTIGSSTASMTITWPASTDASGIDSYRVRYRKVGASGWTTITSTNTSRTVAATLTMSQAYEIQVTARDRGGNTTSSTITTTPTRYSESSARAHYSGAWTLVSGTSYSGGKARTASTAGRSVTYTFTGRSAAWVAAKGPTRGSAKVYVDGVYATTVNLNAASTAYRRVVWTRSWGAAGTHAVKIVVSGTRGHPRVDMDAVIVAR